MSNPNMNPNPQSGGQDDAQTSRYFDNPYGYPYGYPYGPGQPNPNDSNGEWKPVSPFKLMESWLPQRAKNAIRGAYGIIGVIAIVLGLALFIWPGATLKIAAIALGAYNLESRNDAYFWRGESYYRQGEYNKAISDYRTYLNNTRQSNTDMYTLTKYILAYRKERMKKVLWMILL